MTVSTTTNRVTYTGNNSTATYSYTYKIFQQTELLVTVRNTSTNVETTLAISTDYTVTGVGEASGGTIVLQGTGKAWQGTGSNLNTGYVLSIRRVLALTQETDIRNQGDFFPEVHEDVFDKQVMISQQQQDELDRTVKLAETIDPADFDPTIPAETVGSNNLSLVVNSTGDGFAIGPSVSEIEGAAASAAAAAASAAAASTSETNAATSETNAATSETNAATSETNAAASAASAQTAIDTSQDWATKTDGIVEATDYSSKAYAIGGTDVTDTAGRGAAKEWANKTTGTVDTVEYSAKEYAQGTQTRGAAGGGSSKDWAEYTAGTVDDTGYSAKEHAQGVQIRGVAGGGSSKDWANFLGSTVDDTEFSAKHYSNLAATSAADAAAAAASSQWSDVVFITNANSPVTVTDAEKGTLYSVDTSAGAVVINLPSIAGLDLSAAWAVGIKKTSSDANTITINRDGTDTIDGNASKVIDRQFEGVSLIPDLDPSPDVWTSLSYGEVSITGDIVGTTDTQTLTNKTFDDAITGQEISTPSNPAAGYNKLYFKNDDQLYRLNSAGTEEQVGTPILTATVRNEQTSGSNRGTFTSGSWQKAVLNTSMDDTSIVSLSSNQFTLQAGTYEIRAMFSATDGCGGLRARLYNSTGASVVREGTNAYSSTAAISPETVTSIVDAKFTIGSATTYELEYYVTNGGQGPLALSTGAPEVYESVVIRKVK